MKRFLNIITKVRKENIWRTFEQEFINSRCTKSFEMSNVCRDNTTQNGRSSIVAHKGNDEYVNGEVQCEIFSNNIVAKQNK